MTAFGVAALVLPKHAAGGGRGLAAAGTAAITFLGCAFLAFLASVYAFVSALRLRRSLSSVTFYCGLVPMLLFLIGIIWFVLQFVVFKPQPKNELPPGPITRPVSRVIPHEGRSQDSRLWKNLPSSIADG